MQLIKPLVCLPRNCGMGYAGCIPCRLLATDDILQLLKACFPSIHLLGHLALQIIIELVKAGIKRVMVLVSHSQMPLDCGDQVCVSSVLPLLQLRDLRA
eukprot:CAMPEP_0180506412 /NCGR_PEP_ID=MMETSP1036_2-20121128/47965_1 /TAXON_ID=632150 /ORGANISM="Azadinium spinosum, Strain 3D9" /LENGTH=98 /DNA_ID=CAMNT_0022516331 /DNA_START=48 /DNA_END=344 /DNA_ORIENTATION=+